MRSLIAIIIFLIKFVWGQHDPHYVGNRSVIVHLFEWKFKDVANECERFLAPNGYAAVQVSPVHENAIVERRPWWERYQPLSYLIASRSGNEAEFRDMVRRCSAVGVRIFVDAVLNHMSKRQNRIIGTGGSTADTATKSFPAVPYTVHDFHPTCSIRNYNKAAEVRNCEYDGLLDLDQSKPYVQDRILEFLNSLIDLGVAGFRIDAAKHMWPKDLVEIYKKIKNLNTAFGFQNGARPFIYQEVLDLGGEAVKKTDYDALGVVTEMRHSVEISKLFRGKNQLKWMKNWGVEWKLLSSNDALVFVDDHDNQRGRGAGGADILTYRNRRRYIMAVSFMLAHTYGLPRVMSSYEFTNIDQGPPDDNNESIISPTFGPDGQCNNGWVCEHRWKEFVSMVNFRNTVKGTPVTGWWDNGGNQIAFCRKHKGFVVFNNEKADLNETLQTCLPAGTYCNVIRGHRQENECTGDSVVVDENGAANIFLTRASGVLAIHIGEKL